MDARRLTDLEEIKALKARYFRLMDTKQWDAWGDVFTEDCVMHSGPPEAPPVHGRAAIVPYVRSHIEHVVTVHHGHMPEIELTGPATARGTWAMFDFVEWSRPDSGEQAGLVGYGHYLEEYVREADGEWRIARSRLERLRVDPLS
jgi:ketosteroid isomerase-like protein